MIPIYEGLYNFISPDSYINTQEYKTLKQNQSETLKKYNALSDELLKLRNQYKPRDEWNEWEEFMYNQYHIKPSLDSDKINKIVLEIQKTEKLLNDLSDKLKSIKHKNVPKTKYYKDLPDKTTEIYFKGFNITKTGMSYYDNFLNDNDLTYMENEKGLTGYIAAMSPIEYLERCANIYNSTFEAQVVLNDMDNVDKYAKMMQQGTKFNLPVLDYANKTQEGRHRAQAAYECNIEKIPVLIVTNYKE